MLLVLCDRTRIGTCPCTVDAVINPAKLLEHCVNHGLDAISVGHIDSYNSSSETLVSCVCCAFLFCLFKSFNILIRQHDSGCPSFGKSIRGVSTYSASSLLTVMLATSPKPSSIWCEPTPVMSATPFVSFVAIVGWLSWNLDLDRKLKRVSDEGRSNEKKASDLLRKLRFGCTLVIGSTVVKYPILNRVRPAAHDLRRCANSKLL